MSETENKIDPHFMQLVMSMQAGAMQQMGKMASPVSGKVERDLNMAKYSIDILGMIQTKTKGNLTDEEDKLLGHVLYELRMNYVDELKKEQSGESEGAEQKEAEQAQPSEPSTSAATDETSSGSGETEQGSESIEDEERP
jgi:hypothetical protein